MPDAGVGENPIAWSIGLLNAASHQYPFIAQESATAKLGLPPAHSR
jgi:hypothetical protein